MWYNSIYLFLLQTKNTHMQVLGLKEKVLQPSKVEAFEILAKKNFLVIFEVKVKKSGPRKFLFFCLVEETQLEPVLKLITSVIRKSFLMKKVVFISEFEVKGILKALYHLE